VTFSSLFPSAVNPLHGVFILQRLSAVVRRPGNQATVVAPLPYVPEWLRVRRWEAFGRIAHDERIEQMTVYHPRYPLVPSVSMPLHGLMMAAGSYRVMRRLVRFTRVDCIDAHYVYPDGFAALILGRLLGVPVVVSARGTDINLFPSFPSIRPLIRWTLQRAAGVIAVSGALRERIQTLGIPAERVRVIPNGIDPGRFSMIERVLARQRLGLPTTAKVIVAVGSLTESKRHDVLLAAAATIAPRVPSLAVYIIGEGPLRSRLEAHLSRLGLEGHAHLVGARPNEELALWFNAADISCLPSSSEGWPNVVSESIACGTPVVARNVGGIPEIISSPGLGVLVESGTAALADALEAALHRPWDRSMIARQGLERTWDTVAAEVEAYLTECAHGT
jgi:glycosyltransferase involved in cell wall biosynthesis